MTIDRMLTDIDGIAVMRRLRDDGIVTPVLIISALGEIDDRVRGLRAGGDDRSRASRRRTLLSTGRLRTCPDRGQSGNVAIKLDGSRRVENVHPGRTQARGGKSTTAARKIRDASGWIAFAGGERRQRSPRTR